MPVEVELTDEQKNFLNIAGKVTERLSKLIESTENIEFNYSTAIIQLLNESNLSYYEKIGILEDTKLWIIKSAEDDYEDEEEEDEDRDDD